MRLFPALSLAAVLLLAVPSVSAQTAILPFGGYAPGAGYDNGAAFLVGRAPTLDTRGGFVVGFGIDLPFFEGRLPVELAFRPSVEATFLPGESISFSGGEALDLSQYVLRSSGEMIVSFPFPGTVVPSVGLGLSYARYSGTFDASGGATVIGDDRVTAWAIGPSLVAGLLLDRPSVAPFAHARYRFSTPSPQFSNDRPGTALDNGFSAVLGVRFEI